MIIKDLYKNAYPKWIIQYKIETSEIFKASYDKLNDDDEKELLKEKIKNNFFYIIITMLSGESFLSIFQSFY